jgi:hypothetical protein
MSTWYETYMVLAIEIDATISDRPNDIEHIKSGLDSIVDLISSVGSLDTLGTEASTSLLYQMNQFYLQARQHYSYDSWRRRMVKSINDFTIRNLGDLTNFVDSLNWPDDCVPFYWAQISSEIGYDTSEWTICPEPNLS